MGTQYKAVQCHGKTPSWSVRSFQGCHKDPRGCRGHAPGGRSLIPTVILLPELKCQAAWGNLSQELQSPCSFCRTVCTSLLQALFSQFSVCFWHDRSSVQTSSCYTQIHCGLRLQWMTKHIICELRPEHNAENLHDLFPEHYSHT